MNHLTFDPTALVELISPYIMSIGIGAIVLAILMTITMLITVKE